jgi:Uma2 family endonuclease
MAIPILKNITAEQYLVEENNHLEKHEFYKGEVFAMAGAGKNHVIIQKTFFWVDTEKIEVIRYFINQHTNWEQEIYKSTTATLTIPFINVSIPLSEIYKGVF